jgi:hypothetical protein
MASFSERLGFETKQSLQVDRIDQTLRNRLWTIFDSMYFRDWSDSDRYLSTQTLLAREVQAAMQMLWFTFYKEPDDTYPGPKAFMSTLRSSILQQQPWHRVYSALEAFLEVMEKDKREIVVQFANKVLAEENSGYRIVDTQFVPITSSEEIKTIEDALSVKLKPVHSHLTAAIRFLGVGDKRDYRNSIKESISAVESLCGLNTNKRDFADAVKVLKDKIRMHPALKTAFVVLYGYTSNEGGIRHALLDEEKVSGPEAQFMLIACSAFTNYVIASMAEAGRPLDK